MKDAEILNAIETKIEQLTAARDALRKAFAGEVQSAPARTVATAAKKPTAAPKKKRKAMSEETRALLRTAQKKLWAKRKREQAKKQAAK